MSKTTDPENPRICALFDVDGTLTIPRGEVTPEMMDFMKSLSKKITVGIVGGSDLPKQEEQLGVGVAKVFPYNFSQNGLVAYKNGELLEVQTISKHLGEDNVKRLVNWVMKYLADLDIPVKVSCCRCMFACAAIALEVSLKLFVGVARDLLQYSGMCIVLTHIPFLLQMRIIHDTHRPLYSAWDLH